MMNSIYKTLSKTSKSHHSPTQNPLQKFSFFSTNEQQKYVNQTHVEYNKVDKSNKQLTKPSTIRYQPKVANWVNLIGKITMPVQFLTCSNGTSWAGTLLSQEQFSPSSPLLWLPIIFKDDLAYTAKMHLKENDIVYVAGHLCPELLPINLTNDQVNVQVMVHDVHFVRGLDRVKNRFYRASSGRHFPSSGKPTGDDR